MPKKRKIPKKRPRRIEISLPIYGCHLILFFEATLKEMAVYGKRRGISITTSWERRVEPLFNDSVGFCAEYGEDNRDVLVWLEKYPETASEYGRLYHELYHAVDAIAFGIDPGERLSDSRGHSEAKAFLFEYVVTLCNKRLWGVV